MLVLRRNGALSTPSEPATAAKPCTMPSRRLSRATPCSREPGISTRGLGVVNAIEANCLIRSTQVARFEANGLALTDAGARAQVAKLKLELGAECAAMEQEINGDASTVALSRAELEGVPAALVDALPVGGSDMLLVGLKAPTLTPILQHARDPAARRKAYVAGTTRCPDNARRLNRVVALRAQIAGLLGFASHAEGALLCGNHPRHRADAVLGLPSRRWRVG